MRAAFQQRRPRWPQQPRDRAPPRPPPAEDSKDMEDSLDAVEVGFLAEWLIFEHLSKILPDFGVLNWVSGNRSVRYPESKHQRPRPDDTLGYDFAWRDHQDFLGCGPGAWILFEAKGTKDSEFRQCWVSPNEWEVAQASDNYVLVCVSNVKADDPDLAKIQFLLDFPQHVEDGLVRLRPANYTVTVRGGLEASPFGHAGGRAARASGDDGPCWQDDHDPCWQHGRTEDRDSDDTSWQDGCDPSWQQDRVDDWDDGGEASRQNGAATFWQEDGSDGWSGHRHESASRGDRASHRQQDDDGRGWEDWHDHGASAWQDGSASSQQREEAHEGGHASMSWRDARGAATWPDGGPSSLPGCQAASWCEAEGRGWNRRDRDAPRREEDLDTPWHRNEVEDWSWNSREDQGWQDGDDAAWQRDGWDGRGWRSRDGWA